MTAIDQACATGTATERAAANREYILNVLDGQLAAAKHRLSQDKAMGYDDLAVESQSLVDDWARLYDAVWEGLPVAGAGPALTAIELRILDGLGRGLTTGELGAELDMNPYTLSGRVGLLLCRLGARNRAHLVAIAYQRHLLPVAAGTAATS